MVLVIDRVRKCAASFRAWFIHTLRIVHLPFPNMERIREP